MRTWGLMLKFIPFGWNAVLKYQYLGVELLQVRGRQGENVWQTTIYFMFISDKGLLLQACEQERLIWAIPHYVHYIQREIFWK